MTEESAPTRPAWRAWAVAVAKWAIIVALVAFLGASLRDSYCKFRSGSASLSVDWPLLALSLVGQTLGYYACGLAWHRGLIAVGGRVPWWRSVRLWAASNLTKYIPVPGGKLVIPVARATAFSAVGCPAAVTICGFVVESLGMLAVGFVLFALTLPMQMSAFLDPGVLADYPWARYCPYACLIAVPLLALMHPRVLEFATRMGLKAMGRKPREFALSGPEIARTLLWWVLAWAVFGWSFYLLVESVTPETLGLRALPLLATTYAFTWVVAMISFVTPAGLGVREGLLIVLLTPQLVSAVGGDAAPAIAAAISVLSRLWTTAADGLCIGLAFLVDAAVERRVGLRRPPETPSQ